MRFLILSLAGVLCACSATPAGTTTSNSATTATVAATSAPTTTTEATTTTMAPVPVLGEGVESLDLAAEVFGASRVDRFRADTEIVSSRDEAETEVIFASNIAAAYQRQPAGIELSVKTTGAGASDIDVQIVALDESYWVRQAGGQWDQDPAAASLLSLASVSLLSPATLEVILPVLDEVGEEEVAGRPAIHVTGGIEELEVFLTATGVQDLNSFSELTIGSIDLWLDRSGFVSRAEYRFGGVMAATLATEYYRATFELSDFDGAFEIMVPE
ncbi:MAG: hypothetical protein HKN91_00875 [Acidimicrobiia bacterium]|nr:hypothetical protein [Acidimicrobiia bacterium]